jgi:hypothetical protein
MVDIELDLLGVKDRNHWRSFLNNKKASEIQINGNHYKTMAIQPSDFIVANSLNWYEGNAVKYICRHKQKGGKVDLEKAIHYLQLAIEHYYPE